MKFLKRKFQSLLFIKLSYVSNVNYLKKCRSVMQESHRSMKIPRVHNTHRMVQSVLANIMALGGRSDGHIVDDDLYIMRCCVESSPGTHKECFYRERFSGSCQGTASNCGTIHYCGNCLVLWTFFHSLTTDHKETWQRGS